MNIQKINTAIRPQADQLLNHALYGKIRTPDQLRIFMEVHVFAVWDFMSLLKSLQIGLTCVELPWFPRDPESSYLINEIVLAEESDEYLDGRRMSHFEMYLDAMTHAGARVTKLNRVLETIRASPDLHNTIGSLELEAGIREFMQFTFNVIRDGKLHEIAAAFTFGRENLIPEMFHSILKHLQQNFPETELDRLIYYFNRHIELDGDHHGPLANRMIEKICGSDETKWAEMEAVAKLALEKRIGLWNAIEDRIRLANATTLDSLLTSR